MHSRTALVMMASLIVSPLVASFAPKTARGSRQKERMFWYAWWPEELPETKMKKKTEKIFFDADSYLTLKTQKLYSPRKFLPALCVTENRIGRARAIVAVRQAVRPRLSILQFTWINGPGDYRIQSINQSINQSIERSINQSSDQAINQWVNQSINQSSDQAINQSINQSINSINQAINQSINESKVW